MNDPAVKDTALSLVLNKRLQECYPATLAEVVHLIRNKQFLKAIKAFMDGTGLNLQESALVVGGIRIGLEEGAE